MDDLEKAVLISFDESGAVDSGLKSQAIAYCQRIKEVPSICGICIERLCSSKLVQVQFWCLQNLHEAIQTRYATMTCEERSSIRKSVFSLASCSESFTRENHVQMMDCPPFVRNKLAQIIVSLIYIEYPVVWSSVFIDILSNLVKGRPVIDMFCRIMSALDGELISLEYPRTAEELAVASRVKDAMRLQCMAQIVGACFDIVSTYKVLEPDLSATVLESMRPYISWIDIGLIANDVTIPLLFELITTEGLLEDLRSAATGCVLAVVSKRMDPQEKTILLENIQITRVFSLVKDIDSHLLSRLASLLIGFAMEALDCSKCLSSEKSRASAIDQLNLVLPSVFHVMRNCKIDSTFNTVQFLSSYISTMKSYSPLGERESLHLRHVLEVIHQRIIYDPVYRVNLDTLDKIGREEEDRMVDARKDLFVLLRSVGRVAPYVTLIFIRNALASAAISNSEANVEEVEAALSLLYALGESISDYTVKTESSLLGDLLGTVLSTRFPSYSNRMVALVYLEAVARYLKLIQANEQYIPLVLSAFFDERGIHNPNIHVRERASYLFLRVVKLLKLRLVPFIETILQSLQETLSQATSTVCSTKMNAGCEDGTHIFEAIGILIGMEDVPAQKQSEYLSALLTPLCQQVKALLQSSKGRHHDETASEALKIQKIIMGINALSKGFSERLATAVRPSIGLMFEQTLDVLVQVLVVFPEIKSLRTKVTSFLHRMVDTIGALVFPHLPKALELLMAESEPRDLVGFLVLINQLVCKFRSSIGDIIEGVFPFVADKVFKSLPDQAASPSAPAGTVEEIRELQELQKTVFAFLHAMAMHDLSSVFLSDGSRPYFHPVMRLLLHTACTHADTLVRRSCVQIFVRLIKDWCCPTGGEEKVPGFQNFMVEAFATDCCLYSVLDKSFQLNDANSAVLLGEMVVAHKVMYERFGDDFLIHFVARGFPNSRHLALEYRERLQGNDLSALKSFYRSLIENLRLQDAPLR